MQNLQNLNLDAYGVSEIEEVEMVTVEGGGVYWWVDCWLRFGYGNGINYIGDAWWAAGKTITT